MFLPNKLYVSDMCPRGVSAGPRSRYFSSSDGSVAPLCRWISGLVCNSTQPLPRPRLSSWFLRLKMFIRLSSSGLAFSEPLEVDGVHRQALLSEAGVFREGGEQLLHHLAGVLARGVGRGGAAAAGAEAQRQSVVEEPGLWPRGPSDRAARLPLDRDTLVEMSLTTLPPRSIASMWFDCRGFGLVGRWTSMAAMVTTREPRPNGPPASLEDIVHV
ncbi:hypothetical protein EYF80_001963 [Liparis tanakae]|uniref:Uncharacterized protein n=1 Tax=Liparis tanakae TaxID=230148 RepID=A0A4Z2JBN9_9TELE|nr:hypothetical protein EYF80_001963 [Liparis tanakae]